jgi:hypothetical protein
MRPVCKDVCRNAQRNGRAVCPSKSLGARVIEESVVRQIQEAGSGIARGIEWEQMDRARQVAAIQALVARVGYDGRTPQISIRLHSAATRKPETQL